MAPSQGGERAGCLIEVGDDGARPGAAWSVGAAASMAGSPSEATTGALVRSATPGSGDHTGPATASACGRTCLDGLLTR